LGESIISPGRPFKASYADERDAQIASSVESEESFRIMRAHNMAYNQCMRRDTVPQGRQGISERVISYADGVDVVSSLVMWAKRWAASIGS
jgi:hypothetical protein